MNIKWILNNNAVICEDDLGIENVVKGKGIAFGLKKGDAIDQSKIDRIFKISEQSVQRRYQEVLLTIDEDCITVTEDIIDMIRDIVDKDINDGIYVTLTDHIANLLERIRMGVLFENIALWDIKRLYPQEYQAGKLAVAKIEDFFDVKILDDEASFIALHIINAQLGYNMDDAIETTKLIEDIVDIVTSDFGLDVDTESISYTRFIMHLRVFMERIVHGQGHTQKESNDLIVDTLAERYPNQYQTTLKIISYIESRNNVYYGGEILYLLIHIIKITTEHTKGAEL